MCNIQVAIKLPIMFHTPFFFFNLKLFPKILNNYLLEKLIYTIMIKLNPKKVGLTNLPFCFNAFLEKPPFPDMVESNGVEGIGLKYDFFQNSVVMCYFDKLL